MWCSLICALTTPVSLGKGSTGAISHLPNQIHNEQESLANAKVSARQQCVYEGPLSKKSTPNQRREHDVVHAVGYNDVADDTGLSSFV